MLGLVIIVLFVLIAVFAPLIAPYDPTQQTYAYVRKPPSWRNWLGTDESGRDILAASSSARAPRCWPASSRSRSRSGSACRSGCSPAIAAAGSTP